MNGLNERAAAISGAVTGGVLHLLFGLFVWGSPGTMMGAYGSMYYGMMRFDTPAFGAGALAVSLILGAVVGAFAGWLIAATYNWGMAR